MMNFKLLQHSTICLRNFKVMKPTALLVLALAFLASETLAQNSLCSDVATAVQLGVLGDPELDEASGLVASRINPGVLYSHNDHGDYARLFAMLDDGTPIAQIKLGGVDMIDFEDLTITGPEDGSIIYVADFGNNNYDRDVFTIYGFREPDLSNAGDVINIPADEIIAIEFQTEFGATQDHETLMFDPVSKKLYILTKNHDGPEASLYSLIPPQTSSSEPVFLSSLGTLKREMLVAGDISLDGSRIVLRRAKNEGAWMWVRSGTVEETLLNTPSCDLQPILENENQGEAVAFKPDGSGFYTTSEDAGQPIYFYKML